VAEGEMGINEKKGKGRREWGKGEEEENLGRERRKGKLNTHRSF